MEKPKQAFLANPILKEKYNAPSRPLPLLRSLISGSFPLNKVCVLEKRQQRKGPRLSDLVPYLYFSLPLYSHKGFD